MKTNRKEIELDENDRDLMADEAERLGKHWKQVLKEKLSIVQHPVHADADGQVAPKTTLVAALE